MKTKQKVPVEKGKLKDPRNQNMLTQHQKRVNDTKENSKLRKGELMKMGKKK